MNTKREIPTWSVVVIVVAVVAFVGVIFVHNGSGDASKEDLTQIRQNQQRFSASGPHPAPVEAPKK